MSRNSTFGLGTSSRAFAAPRAIALGPPPIPCASSSGTENRHSTATVLIVRFFQRDCIVSELVWRAGSLPPKVQYGYMPPAGSASHIYLLLFPSRRFSNHGNRIVC